MRIAMAKATNEFWLTAAGQIVASVRGGEHSASDVISMGWMDDVIRAARGPNAFTGEGTLASIDDVHDLLYDVAPATWAQEQRVHRDRGWGEMPINGFSPYSDAYNGYSPVRNNPTPYTGYAGVAGGVNIWQQDDYGVGFGPGDLRRALEDGYSREDILRYLDTRYTNGYGYTQGVIPDSVRNSLTNPSPDDPEPPTPPDDPDPPTPPDDPDVPTGPHRLLITDYDQTPNVFDSGDYKTHLLRLWQEHKDSGNLDQVLRNFRTDVLDEIESGALPSDPAFYAQLQRERGYTTGRTTFDNSAQGADAWRLEHVEADMTSWFGYYETPDMVGSAAEQQRRFNLNDMLAMKAANFDAWDIWMYMRANPDKLQYAEGDDHYPGVIPGSAGTLQMLEDELVTRGNLAITERFNSPTWRYDPDGFHMGPQLMKHPYFRKIGEYINRGVDAGTIDRRYHPRDMVDEGDFHDIRLYLRDHAPENLKDFNDFTSMSDVFRITGRTDPITGAAVGAGQIAPTQWDPGTYWEHWGASGPSELTDVQQLVAGGRLYAAIDHLDFDNTEQAEDRLNYLEQRWLNELYSPQGTMGGGGTWYPDLQAERYEQAEDAWGLDIKRVWDESHGEAGWTDDDTVENQIWWDNLTKGRIDWAFYDTSEQFQAARVALGLDTNTNYSHSRSIEEIRTANLWVHGQESPREVETRGTYEAEFDPDTQPDWSPVELSISGRYNRERRNIPVTTMTQITAPNINVSTNPSRVPTNLANWPTLENNSGDNNDT